MFSHLVLLTTDDVDKKKLFHALIKLFFLVDVLRENFYFIKKN